jgi:hypothetical protein
MLPALLLLDEDAAVICVALYVHATDIQFADPFPLGPNPDCVCWVHVVPPLVEM